MRNENEMYGAGMGLTRTINGKRVNLSRIKKADQQRMDMVVEMSARHARLLVEQDWLGLYDLAWEYDGLGATDTCQRILLEIPTGVVKSLQTSVTEQINQYVTENPDVLTNAKPIVKVKLNGKRKDSHS